MNYVALSRVTSLKGLYIVDLNIPNICTSPIVDKYITLAQKKHRLTLSYMPIHESQADTLNIVYHNARSYKKHFEDVMHDYNIKKGDLISISETRLKQTNALSRYTIPCYTMYCTNDPRTMQQYHGMITYVKSTIPVIENCQVSTQNIDMQKLQIVKNEKMLDIITTYMSPKTSFTEVSRTIDDVMCGVPSLPTILIGDMNINANNTTHQSFIWHIEKKLKLSQMMQYATTNEGSTIDLLFSNTGHNQIGSIPTYWSDHHIIYTTIPL